MKYGYPRKRRSVYRGARPTDSLAKLILFRRRGGGVAAAKAARAGRGYTKGMGVRIWVFGALFAAAAGAGVPAGPGRFLGLLAAGLLAWTLIEYLLHRLAFHGFAPHTEHHAVPTEIEYLLAPLWLSLSATAVLFALFSLAARSWTSGGSMISGVIAGYLAYEAIHLRIHRPAPGGALLGALRKHHFYHHFASDRVCYGVTSPVWDRVFGSLPGSRSHKIVSSGSTAYRPPRPEP